MSPDEAPPEKEEGTSPYQWLRSNFFPIKKTDTGVVKAAKQSAFYLFAAMALIITILIVAAILFVM